MFLLALVRKEVAPVGSCRQSCRHCRGRVRVLYGNPCGDWRRGVHCQRYRSLAAQPISLCRCRRRLARPAAAAPTFAVPVPADAPKGESKHAGKRAVVVGNGPSVVRGGGAKPLGAVIDSYDHVYRFNLFKTKGYEEHVGTKTTHWILSMIKKAADIDDDEVPAISKHLEEILVPLAFRECSNPAKGCPGLKPPKSAVKKMKDMLEEQKAWKDLPPNVKVSGEPPLLLLSPSFVPPTRLPLHPNHHITLRLQYRRDDD